jgi:hypothetical protein
VLLGAIKKMAVIIFLVAPTARLFIMDFSEIKRFLDGGRLNISAITQAAA